MSRWLGLALAIGLAVPAWAEPADGVNRADEAEFHFRRGLTLERRGQVEEALAEFYASNRLVPNRNVQMNIASALGRLGLFDEAFRAYSELERQEQPGEEKADVERALSFLRPKLALVRVESKPPGASIFVERRDLGALGVTPKTLALPPGQARILLDLPGYDPAQLETSLEQGKEKVAFAELSRIYGVLDFTALPEQAEVRRESASGELLRRGPGQLPLEMGRVTLHLSAKGFIASRLETEVPPKASRLIDLGLVREPPVAKKVGTLVVRANLDGALVRIDGAEMGFTPVVIEGVEAGARVVEVTREGREPFTERLLLDDKERRFLDVKLRPKRLVVAGATQRLIRLEDAPASMTVITADEIRAFGYLTVADALRSVRGLHVWSDRAYESVGVRGFGLPENANSRVLVLLNGHPMNDLMRNYGPIGSDLGIDLGQVERIEVVRGGGMVFGSTGLLGLVNVVTREPEVGTHVQVGGAARTFGGLDARAAVSRRGDWGEVLGLAGGGAGRGSSLLLSDGREAPDGSKAVDLRLFGRVGRWSLTAGVSSRQKEIPTEYRWSNQEKLALADERSFLALQYHRAFAGGSFLLARAALDSSSFVLEQGPQGAQGNSATGQADGFSGEFRFEWAASPFHRLTLGGAGRGTARMEFEAISQGKPMQLPRAPQGGVLTLYASDEWVPATSFRVHAGLRADPVAFVTQDVTRIDKASFSLQPHVAVLAKPYEGGNTKLLVGATERGPSEWEQKFNLAGFLREAPLELRQETRLAAELEHSHALNDETLLTGTVFLNAYRNVIGSGPVDPGSAVLRLGNSTEDYGAVGTELEVRYTPGDGKLLTASGAVQGSTTRAGERLANFPEHVVSGRFVMPVLGPNLNAATELVFVGARFDRLGERIDESLYWNVVLSGEHLPWHLTYFGGVFNMLDERRPDPVGPELVPSAVPRYGREVRVGASRRF